MDFGNMIGNLLRKGSQADALPDRDEIAKVLRVSPELLEQFENSYKRDILDSGYDTGNLMDVPGKKIYHTDVVTREELARRIADEIHAVHTGALPDTSERLVTKEELDDLPPGERPQCTATLWHRDVNDSMPSLIITYMLSRYMNATDEKDRMISYNMFRSGLDSLDLDDISYAMLGCNRNTMGYWFPALKAAVDRQDFFRVPETKIVKVPLPILQLTRCFDYGSINAVTKDIVNRWCMKAFDLDITKTYFVKTGTFSSKYDFRNAKVTGEKEVRELGEYLLFLSCQAVAMCSMLNSRPTYGVSTTNEWVVREYIEDVENNPTIYRGMPLHTEYRFFADFDTKQILGVSSYWRPDVMKQRFGHEKDADSPHNFHDYIIYSMHEPVLMKRYEDNVDRVRENLMNIIENTALTGQWSIDIMQNGDEFHIIDMAVAENSALKDCVPEGLLRKEKENWIPELLEASGDPKSAH